ncbi:MAG: hypothetical protein ACOX0M_04230 [Salinivirgaceae bacterium]|jgi:hypothetical protein|nr:hypothetical protein [Bacteroidales bacterium]
MRQIFLLLIIGLVLSANTTMAQSDELVNSCALNIGNATYLKDFKYKMPQSAVKPPPSTKNSIVLNKGTIYKFSTCNADGYEGKLIVEIFDGPNKLVSNLKADGAIDNACGFSCMKAGIYQINAYFYDGKEGAAVCVMSYITVK